MRVLMLLGLLAAAPAAGQQAAIPSPDPARRPAADAVAPAGVAPAPLPPELAPRFHAARAMETAAAQSRRDDFLYQVLLSAVTALVTALIWKAVWD